MDRTWVDCTGSLDRERSECQGDPEPPGQLVVVFEFIPSGRYQTAVDNTEILVVFSVDIDNQAGGKSSVDTRVTLQKTQILTEQHQTRSFVFPS